VTNHGGIAKQAFPHPEALHVNTAGVINEWLCFQTWAPLSGRSCRKNGLFQGRMRPLTASSAHTVRDVEVQIIERLVTVWALTSKLNYWKTKRDAESTSERGRWHPASWELMPKVVVFTRWGSKGRGNTSPTTR
jgi:hypothetical protein